MKILRVMGVALAGLILAGFGFYVWAATAAKRKLSGCHRDDLGGGPIIGGDPSWPPAANLTKDGGGVRPWTFTQPRRQWGKGSGRMDGSCVPPWRLSYAALSSQP